MDLEGELEPYRNAEAYRNLQPATLPNHVEQHLDFLDINDEGFLLLGSSNLTGRYWTGSLWYFIEPEAAPNVEKCLTGTDCESGVCNGKFLNDQQKVIIGEDSGNIQILALSEVAEEHTFHFSLSACACDHDDYVCSVGVFKGKSQAVSGGADCVIKVWDVESLVAEHTYRPAHSNQVTSVATQPTDGSEVFASCSLDGKSLLWDSRNPKPASELLKGTAMTAVEWQHSTSHVVGIGGINGEVSFVDIRQPKQKISKITCFPRSVHGLCFDRGSLNKLAVCGDLEVVKVIDCMDVANPVVCYEDGRHNDFVRGLSWHPSSNMLFSCGWDKQVLTHAPLQVPEEGCVSNMGDCPVASSPAQNMDINGS
ncbi:hypothetical protein R5R35_000689 [Gryllus longicercus]|uniref:Methylosome protein 50 n=1 Tax=Gryllus longicercus TaxID=2509291 RepID=A0AAN9VV47_9ORTH